MQLPLKIRAAKLTLNVDLTEKLLKTHIMTEKRLQHEDLVRRISRANPTLTEGARRVAALVLTKPEEVALLSAAKVAEHLGVSESTVVRLAAAVGYDGYPDLRRALQDGLRRHLQPARRLDAYAANRNEESAVARSFQSDMNDLAATERHLDISSLHDAANFISSARSTYILGLRSSHALAFTLYHHLGRTLNSVRLLNPAHGDTIDQLVQINEQDLLVAISFPRYTRATIDVMRLVAKRETRIVAITDSAVSPLAQYADIVLTASCSSDPFANSNVGALALINALVSQIAISNRERSVRSLERLDELLQDSAVLYSDADAHSEVSRNRRKHRRSPTRRKS